MRPTSAVFGYNLPQDRSQAANCECTCHGTSEASFSFILQDPNLFNFAFEIPYMLFYQYNIQYGLKCVKIYNCQCMHE